MALIGPRTIRAKLTILTMLVMGALLGLCGVGLDQGVKLTLMKGIDNELKDRSLHGPLRFMLRDRSRPQPDMPGGHDPGSMPMTGPPDGRFGGGPPDGGGGPPGDRSGFGGGPVGFPPDQQPDRSAAGNAATPASGGSASAGQASVQGKKGPQEATDVESQVLPPAIWFVGPLAQNQWQSPNRRRVPYDTEDFARAKLGSGHFLYKTISVNGEPYRLLTAAFKENGHVVAVSQMTDPLAETYKTLAGMRQALITLVIPSGVVLSGLASLYLVGRFMRPLRLITGNAESIGANNPAERLPVVGQDEFASLATTLNGMLARLEQGLRLEQETNRRLEETVMQQRRFTEDASHELKTPLAVIKANTGLMLHFGGSAEENRESIETIDTAADRMTHMVQDLLMLARAEAGQLATRFKPTDLGSVVQDSVCHVANAKGRVKIEAPHRAVQVMGSADDLSRVFVNLLDNALRYSESDCPVEFTLMSKGKEAIVTVQDYGKGIAAQHLDHLFDRFYRIDESRSSDTGGTGLGLAICKGIVEAHGGQIEVFSAVDKGTRFAVKLPILAE